MVKKVEENFKSVGLKFLAGIVALLVLMCAVPATGITANAGCSKGIAGNGTNGINININAAPYTTFQNYSYGGNAYTMYGCGWFASARTNQLTGKGNTIWNGNGWWNNGNGRLGFSCGKELRAPALACYSGHVVVVEAVNGNNVTISEGGSGYTDADHGYCRIVTMTISQFSNYCNGFLGYVYLKPLSEPRGIETKVVEISKNQDWYRLQTTFESEIGIETVRFPTWTVANGQDDLLEDWGTSPWTWGSQISRNGNIYTYEYTVYTSMHHDERGEYVTHVYAVGRDGKFYFVGNTGATLSEPDTVPPTISDIKSANLKYNGFDISCLANDDGGVKEVTYSVWTTKGAPDGKDDIKTINANNTNGRWTAHVNIADHNNESGEYNVQVTAWDNSNNQSSATIKVNVPAQNPVITKQPLSVTASDGDFVDFLVEAQNADKYEWSVSDDGSTWQSITQSCLGTNMSHMYVIVNVYSLNKYYRCKVTSASGVSIYSNAVKLTEKLNITKQPSDVEVSEGGKAAFEVVAAGAKSYKWYYSQDGGKKWKAATQSGYNKKKITITATADIFGQLFRCTVTGNDGQKITSNAVTIKEKLTITGQPTDVFASVGDTVSFSVKAAGVKSYKWYYSDDEGSTWKAVTQKGYNKSKLSISVTESNIGQQYKCKLTGKNGKTLKSKAATIKQKLKITKQPKSVFSTDGEKASFAVTAVGVKAYKWYYSTDGGSTWKATSEKGYNTRKLTVSVTKSKIGMQFKCKLTGEDGKTAKSKAVTIKQKLVVTKQPASVTAAVGDKVSFKVTALGVESYQWYYSKDKGKTWKALTWSGSDTNKLSVSVTKSRLGLRFRCELLGNDGNTILSKAVALSEKTSTKSAGEYENLAENSEAVFDSSALSDLITSGDVDSENETEEAIVAIEDEEEEAVTDSSEEYEEILIGEEDDETAEDSIEQPAEDVEIEEISLEDNLENEIEE